MLMLFAVGLCHAGGLSPAPKADHKCDHVIISVCWPRLPRLSGPRLRDDLGGHSVLSFGQF
jgi:hypothetical protein